MSRNDQALQHFGSCYPGGCSIRVRSGRAGCPLWSGINSREIDYLVTFVVWTTKFWQFISSHNILMLIDWWVWIFKVIFFNSIWWRSDQVQFWFVLLSLNPNFIQFHSPPWEGSHEAAEIVQKQFQFEFRKEKKIFYTLKVRIKNRNIHDFAIIGVKKIQWCCCCDGSKVINN